MSLILDALRKADSERERGSVPGLHAQPVPPSAATPPQARARPWSWAAIGVLAGLLVALGWSLIGRDAPRREAETAAAPGGGAPALEPASRAAAAATALPPAPAAAGAVHPSEPSPARPSVPQFVAEPAPWPSPEQRKPATQAAPEAPAPAQAKPAEAAGPAPAAAPIHAREQLPENIRAELPPLAIGGAIYSTRPADRSVIINGRIYRENDALTADLSLEQIKLNAAVLRYKGYRFEIGF